MENYGSGIYIFGLPLSIFRKSYPRAFGTALRILAHLCEHGKKEGVSSSRMAKRKTERSSGNGENGELGLIADYRCKTS
jgi:hypothetical protein